jgi:hypothetical protein
VEDLLRNAERILETAVLAKGDEAQDCTICISRLGEIRILVESAGWSLAALAAELGAKALFQVQRRGGTVRVEGWSPEGSCVLRRDLSSQWREPVRRGFPDALRYATLPYATLPSPENSTGSENDRLPQVWNS